MSAKFHARDSFLVRAGHKHWPSSKKKPLFLLSKQDRQITRTERKEFDKLVSVLSEDQRKDKDVTELGESLFRGPGKTEVPMIYGNRLFIANKEIRIKFGLPRRRPY